MKENPITPAARGDREDRRRKRRAIVAFALAATAIGGIGAALTSAAWTDNVFFAADAEAATFNLQGSLNGTDWVESDDDGDIELLIPASTFGNLLPGQTRTFPLHVRNTGTATAALVGSAVFVTSTFDTDPTPSLSGLAATLTPAGGGADADEFTLTVTTPSDWAAGNQGDAGVVSVTVAGTATS